MKIALIKFHFIFFLIILYVSLSAQTYRAVIYKGTRFGYIDEKGDIKLQPKYAVGLDYHFGVAGANFILKPDTTKIFPIRYYLKMVRKFALINLNGELLTDPIYKKMIYAGNGLFLVGDKKSALNNIGVSAIEKFSGPPIIVPGPVGLAMHLSGSQTESHQRYSWGLLNSQGKEILPVKYSRIGPVRDGLIAVEGENEWAYYNTKGEKKIEIKQAAGLGDFNDGIAKINYHKFGRDTIQYIDTLGNILTSSKHSHSWSFYDGLARIKDKTKFGYMDINSNIIIPLIYEQASDFKYGMARVLLNGKWSYINTSGKLIQIPKAIKLFDFDEYGYAIVFTITGYGMIDKEGNWFIRPFYERLNPFCGGLAAFQRNKWGFIDTSGQEVIIPKYYLVKTPEKTRSPYNYANDKDEDAFLDNEYHYINYNIVKLRDGWRFLKPDGTYLFNKSYKILYELHLADTVNTAKNDFIKFDKLEKIQSYQNNNDTVIKPKLTKSISLGFLTGNNKNDSSISTGFNLNLMVSYNPIKNYYIGIGAGLNFFPTKMVSTYIDNKFFLGDHKFKPFMYGKIGYSFQITIIDVGYEANGFLADVGFGFSLKSSTNTKVYFCLGFLYQRIKYSNPVYVFDELHEDYTIYYDDAYFRIPLKIGLMF